MRCGVVLVEAYTVEAERVHFFPDREMFLVSARRDLGVEVIARQRIGQMAVCLVLVEVLVVGEEVEKIDFHGQIPCANSARSSDVRGINVGVMCQGGR